MATQESTPDEKPSKKEVPLSKQSREVLHIKSNILEQEVEKKKQLINDHFLAEKERLKEKCREISHDLYELKLEKARAASLADGEIPITKPTRKRWRRRKIRTMSKEEMERKRQEEIKKRVQERLPKSIRKFVNRMLRHRKQTYGIITPILSDTSTSDSGDSADEDMGFRRTPFMGENASKTRLKHRQISPVPAHLLKIPKPKIERPPAAVTFEDDNGNWTTVFGTMRPPVYRQFPNNSWQRSSKWCFTERTSTTTYDEMLPNVCDVTTTGKQVSTPRTYNIYDEKILLATSQSCKQFIHVNPLGWPLEQPRRHLTGHTPASSHDVIKSKHKSAPVTRLKTRYRPRMPTSTCTSDESFPDDTSSDSEFQIEVRTKLTLPHVTVTTPAIRDSRTSADNQSKDLPFQKDFFSPSRLLQNPPNTPDILPHYTFSNYRYVKVTPLPECTT